VSLVYIRQDSKNEDSDCPEGVIMRHMAGILATLCLLLPLAATADNATHADGYTIHHNALTTDALPVQVATAYRLERSKRRGLLNVSVLKDHPGKLGTPVRADIKCVARTLFGQIRPIELREIVEGKAVYYIADFPVSHREVLIFDLEVMPEGGRYPLRAQMRHEFFTD
jgi:hypothetical protein